MPNEEIKKRLIALYDLGRMVGWIISWELIRDEVDATTFGSFKKTYLVGSWRLNIKGQDGEEPSEIWQTGLEDPDIAIDMALTWLKTI